MHAGGTAPLHSDITAALQAASNETRQTDCTEVLQAVGSAVLYAGRR